MTDHTSRFALPLLQAGQAQKELFHNEALTLVDGVLHPSAIAFALNDPPELPGDGQCWIIGTAPTGAWLGQAGCIAIRTPGGWRFPSPRSGMSVWIEALGRWVWHNGIGWQDGALPTAGLMVAGKRVIGERRPAIAAPVGGAILDQESRQVTAAILDVLRDHGLIEH